MNQPTSTLEVQDYTPRSTNWRTLNLIHAPLTRLHGTEHDAWVDGEYRPNPVWHAAMAESQRRSSLFHRGVPVDQWGVTS